MLQLSQLKSRGELGPVWPADNPLNHSVGSALTSWPVLSYSFNLGGVFNDKELSIINKSSLE